MLSDIGEGEAPFSHGLAAKLLREFRRSGTYDQKPMQQMSGESNSGRLTERQLEVLEMVAKVIPYKEAGEALGLTERTVKYHMARILELLHLKNRAQVIAYAARMGLVKDEETGK